MVDLTNPLQGGKRQHVISSENVNGYPGRNNACVIGNVIMCYCTTQMSSNATQKLPD